MTLLIPDQFFCGGSKVSLRMLSASMQLFLSSEHNVENRVQKMESMWLRCANAPLFSRLFNLDVAVAGSWTELAAATICLSFLHYVFWFRFFSSKTKPTACLLGTNESKQGFPLKMNDIGFLQNSIYFPFHFGRLAMPKMTYAQTSIPPNYGDHRVSPVVVSWSTIWQMQSHNAF